MKRLGGLGGPAPRRLPSEVIIEHAGQEYRLRHTRTGS
ncbi:MAG: hemin uptake protein HemP [Gammaproteobacteria bacterium]